MFDLAGLGMGGNRGASTPWVTHIWINKCQSLQTPCEKMGPLANQKASLLNLDKDGGRCVDSSEPRDASWCPRESSLSALSLLSVKGRTAWKWVRPRREALEKQSPCLGVWLSLAKPLKTPRSGSLVPHQTNSLRSKEGKFNSKDWGIPFIISDLQPQATTSESHKKKAPQFSICATE